MNDIRRDVGKPLAKKLDVMHDLCDTRDDEVDHTRWTINNLCDQLDVEHCLRCRLEEKLAKYKGKQKEESEATMDSPLHVNSKQWVSHRPRCCQQCTCQQTSLWR